MTTYAVLGRLAQQLEEERALPYGERSSAADDAGLDGVLSLTARAREAYAAGRAGLAVDLLAQAARIAADSWSHSSRVAGEVLSVHQALARAAARR